MLRNLTVEQRALADFMSELSVHAFDAEWMENLEHVLWRATVDGPFRYGNLEITSQQTAKLRALSASCGGWVVFNEAHEETFIQMLEWREMYDKTLGH